MNLNEKILELRNCVSTLKKEQQGYGYTYVNEEQILGELKGKMEELKILLEPSIVPNTITIKDITYTNAKGKAVTDILTKGDMIYTFVDVENNEKKEVCWAFTGQQSEASQSFGSGLTYAQRYFLLKYFNIVTTDDDPDKIKADKEAKAKEEAEKELIRLKNNITKLFSDLLAKFQSKDVVYTNLGTTKEDFVKKYNGNITDLADLKEQMEAILNDKQ